MTGHVKIGGTWKQVAGVSVKIGGSWKEVTNGYTKVSGAWKEFYSAGSPGPYWLSQLGGVGVSAQIARGQAVAVDSSSNSYSCGNVPGVSGSADMLLVKRDDLGEVLWQRKLGNSSQENAVAVDTDSSGDVYVTSVTTISNNDIVLAKYNSSGTLQWQKRLYSTGSEKPFALTISSNDDVYIAGQNSSNRMLIAKYDTSGTLQWQIQLNYNNFAEARSLATDSSGNLYVSGWDSNLGAILAKYNSSGTLQWQRSLNNIFLVSYAVTTDSLDNVYIGIENYISGSTYRPVIVKYNSSGTLQWQKTFNVSTTENVFSLSSDSLNNTYLFGVTRASGNSNGDMFIAKHNSSGTLQWQRKLGYTGGTNQGLGITIDSFDDVHIAGYAIPPLSPATGFKRDFFLGKIPSDGSLTGTYSIDSKSFVYAATSYTQTAGSLTASTPSGVTTTTSLSTGNTTLTDTAGTSSTITLTIG